MDVYATITAVDTPTPGYYTARTIFGTEASGVSLLGIDSKLKVGQKVAVWQVGGGFGAFGGMGGKPSYLLVPGSHLAALIAQAPDKAFLYVLAYEMGQVRPVYSTGTVTGISGSRLIVNGVSMASAVPASDFEVGNTVLLSLSGKTSSVMGFWNCVPGNKLVSAILFERRPYTATIEMIELNEEGFLRTASVSPNPAYEYVDSAWQYTLNTDNTKDYFYTYIHFFRNWGAAYEDRWVKWHKKNFTVETITLAEYNAEALIQPAYNKTKDDKFFWWDIPSNQLSISDTSAGARTPVMKVSWASGALSTAYFPKQDYAYGVKP